MILVKILPVCYLFTCCIYLSFIQTILVAREEEELKHDNVHKLMSEKDLQRTFQVDSHDQVPEYEILKLTVDDDGSHLISPISDLGELTTAPLVAKTRSRSTPATTTTTTTTATTSSTFKHEPEEAEEAQKAEANANRSRSNSRTSTRHKRSSDWGCGTSDDIADPDVEQPVADRDQAHKAQASQANRWAPGAAASEPRGRAHAGPDAGVHDKPDDDDKLIVMKLSTFGRDFRLRLKRNADFQQRIKDMKMFMAESTEDGQLRYTEIKPSAAKGAAQAAPSQARNIGATYHDEDNLAALLIEHDKRTGLLQVDGTIGNDFVIKPMPAIVTPPPAYQVSHHIVYRQKPSSESSSSDHQHSFMASPSVMEQMAASFSSQRLLNKRSAVPGNAMDDVDDELDEAGTDQAGDPLGGQFFLEPGMVTGTERAGYSDWRLLGARQSRAPPPYALNSSTSGTSSSYAERHQLEQRNPNNRTRARFRRSARRFNGQVRRKRQAPDTVWPEVLLVVDYDSFLLHGGDSRDVKRYFVSFWNGVDLRYKLLVHPHIRISLAGMIVAKDRDATPYLERNRLRAPNADAVDAAGALTDMGKYLYREDRLPTYDLAVVITKLDMCRRRYEGGRCNRGTAGFAYVGGACVVNKRLEKVNSVAIIEDSGGFSGVIVAAHEVGHL